MLRDIHGEPNIYPGVTCIKLKNKEGGSTAFYTRKDNYVIGNPTIITIPVADWVGSRYTITTSEYGEVGNLQLGIPIDSSMDNAQRVIECALTIPIINNKFLDKDDDDILETYDSTTIVISAKEPPTKDITICIWGLEK